jgi:vacuolar-type H+-ATPase subunit F/Vma7
LATLAVIGNEKAVIGYKIVGNRYLIAVIGNNVAVNGNKPLGDYGDKMAVNGYRMEVNDNFKAINCNTN